MSWIQSSQDPNYTEALQATELLGEPAVGFSRIPADLTIAKAAPLLVKQNNLLIQQVTALHTKVDFLVQKVQSLEEKLGLVAKDEPKIQEALSILAQKLNQVKISDKTQSVQTRKVYHFVNPKIILEKELKRPG